MNNSKTKGSHNIASPSKSTQYKKPPLGLRPKKFWNEERVNNIIQAINRYVCANKQIPVEWVEEYNELIKGGTKLYE